MNQRIGVGFVGAGGVVRSIHLPALARMADDFYVGAVWDINPQAAETVVARVGGRVVESFEELLADESVDVLVVCTPARCHADHVARGMRAGKRAILCEKPLAATIEDTQLILEAAAETNVPLIVGAMHRFDPAWTAVLDVVAELRAEATSVRSSIVLPFNARFEQWATEAGPPAAPGSPPEGDMSQYLMRLGVTELAIHDMPLVRSFLPEGQEVTVTSASLLSPFGYNISVSAGDRVVDLFGYMNANWAPCWELEAISPSTALHVEFPPSFVRAGSGVSTVTRQSSSQVFGPAQKNGYEKEWEAMRDLARGKGAAIPSVEDVIADFRFALTIAEQSCALLAKGGA